MNEVCERLCAFWRDGKGFVGFERCVREGLCVSETECVRRCML